MIDNKILHYSVLLDESIELLHIKPNGVYVDGTFGRGGHSQEILKRLNSDGRLIVFDKDMDAINYGMEKFASDDRIKFIHDSFANIDIHLEELNIKAVDGILLDLGVSSPQLDDDERGFSFMKDALLDMRMDQSQKLSAKDIVNGYSYEQLVDIFDAYGEEKFAKKIAKKIIEQREIKLINTTRELANLISNIIFSKDKHPATRVFQALRIEVNKELSDLEVFLNKFKTLLNNDAYVVIISFHSLEDRLVKNKFNELSKVKEVPKWINVAPEIPDFSVVSKKQRAKVLEVIENSRSRSAILRALNFHPKVK